MHTRIARTLRAFSFTSTTHLVIWLIKRCQMIADTVVMYPRPSLHLHDAILHGYNRITSGIHLNIIIFRLIHFHSQFSSVDMDGTGLSCARIGEKFILVSYTHGIKCTYVRVRMYMCVRCVSEHLVWYWDEVPSHTHRQSNLDRCVNNKPSEFDFLFRAHRIS